jgi:kinesin family protein 4/21/27
VEQCFQGYNAAILAYGQTGSGKTYTMGTYSSQKIPSEEAGILPRVISNIFEEVRKNKDMFKYTIKATFL